MAPPTAGSAAGPTMSDHIAESRRRHAEALEMGGAQAVDRHRASGRLPVRERIALLTDEGSWFETGALAQPERRMDKKVPNEIICSGDRLALRFTEHGASARHDGARAAWGGIGLYRWDGQRLLENFVEQDYFARRRQLTDGAPDPVERPAIAPWDTPAVPPDPAAEAVVRAWLAAGDLPGASVDDGLTAHRIVAAERTEIDDLFSAGNKVAFHAIQHGPLAGDDPQFTGDGLVSLHLAGVVSVAGGQVCAGRVIRDRLGLFRRLSAAAGATEAVLR